MYEIRAKVDLSGAFFFDQITNMVQRKKTVVALNCF